MENLFNATKKLILIVSLFLLFSCDKEEALNNDSTMTTSESLSDSNEMSKKEFNVFKGPEVAFGNGSTRSWVSVSKETGMPLEIGIEMTPEALEGHPDVDVQGPTIVLPLHLKARQLTPFKHIGINWQSHGHTGGPPGSFTSEHIDFHFYTISNKERLAIPDYSPTTADGFLNLPPTGYIPSDYASPGPNGSYGQMGKHWLPVNLLAYLPFTKIMVYGSYDGKLVFLEPMVALDYLLSNEAIGVPYSQPLHFAEAGNYPTKYNIWHNAKNGNINVTLSEFVAR